MLETFKEKAREALNHFQNQLKQIRTGRAQPAILDSVLVTVEAYGGAKMRLPELASIAAPDASLLTVQPFDPSVLPDIERAIMTANLGLNPSTDQNIIRIAIPALTAERRAELLKLVAQRTEEARIGIRNLRNQIKNDIEDQADSAGISEDDIKRQLEQLQVEVENINEQIEAIKAEKEKDLTTL